MSAPASITDLALASEIPPMATRGLRVSWRACLESLESDYGIGIGLAGGGEDRARWRCSRPRSGRRLQLIGIVSGGSDDQLWPDNFSNGLDGEIVLSDMDAVETGGKRQVGTVVHDQRDASAKTSAQFTGVGEHLA